MGTPFKVIERRVTAQMAADGLAKTHYHLAEVQSNELMSPWHDVELIPSTFQSNHITGVTEITRGTTAKMECSPSLPFNPVLSDTRRNKETG